MLKNLLQSMLNEAYQKLKTPVKRKLKGNLHLTITMTSKDVTLAIARDKTYPSASEWKTTLANFPYMVPQVAPTLFVDNERRYAMRAQLPRRDQVLQQMTFGAAAEKPQNTDADPAQDAAV